MKRKADTQSDGHHGKGILKKRAKTVLSTEEVQKSFRKGLFSPDVLQNYTKEYSESKPYKHSVIGSLIDDDLLRSVRNEIRDNVHFTPKETDIYRIHQSGDLANLDGLDDGALEKLPSLLRLRDALYSSVFRKYVTTITGSGELSGRKTDMAINVYTPGCHLLCHDDVIGSRRVSYILYLTDPDFPWKEEWGGALRLYPTKTFEDDGEKTITPSPEFTKVIPPAWNQLSFFAVQPGESFHDVEEVYHAESKEVLETEGGRIRMAISGWYHIPQIGEEGYVKGAEEKWGANSSLMQLQGHPDKYDFPRPQTVKTHSKDIKSRSEEEEGFEPAEIDFLLKYMAPTYLTPDTMEQVAERFLEFSSVILDVLLSSRFSTAVKEYVNAQEALSAPSTSVEIEESPWDIARPPHKHRYLYLQQNLSSVDTKETKSKAFTPIQELLQVFLPSPQFRKWLELATHCEIESADLLARRFRRGLDYSLATSHDGESRLEISLGLTPTPGWGADEADGTDKRGLEQANGAGTEANKQTKSNGNGAVQKTEEEDDVGGYEVYMAGDDDEANGDAAIYKTSSDAEDDNVLFTMPASWNKMSIVLRDSGVLKFVKYVSKHAKGDRWDISGSFGVKETDDDDDDDDEEESQQNTVTLESSDEETFNGFPESEDSDSD